MHKKAYIKSSEPPLSEQIATRWNDQVLSFIAKARKIDYYETGDNLINWAVDKVAGVGGGAAPQQVSDVVAPPTTKPRIV